jgi:type IV pilus assembly protein PilM
MLAYEAQQYVPFPLEEVVLDFLPAGRRDEQQDALVEVLLVAARRGSVENVRSVLAQSGVRASSIGVMPVAQARLYASGFAAQAVEGMALVVEIEANGSTITVLDDGIMRLTRSVSVGGDSLARAISEDFACDLAQADQTMRSRGLEVMSDPQARPAVRAWLGLLAAEMERSVLALTSGGAAPAVRRILLCGSEASLPGLSVRLAQATGVEVDLFPSPAGEAAGAARLTALPRAQRALETGSCAALALAFQGLRVRAERQIDLLAAMSERPTVGRRRRAAALAAACALAAVLIGFSFQRAVHQRQSALKARAELAAARRVDAQIGALEERKGRLEAQLRDIDMAAAQRFSVLRTLEELGKKAPTGVWLTSLTISPQRQGREQNREVSVAISGKAAANDDVAQLVSGLSSSRLFREVSLVNARPVEEKEAKVVEFSLTAKSGREAASSLPTSRAGSPGRAGKPAAPQQRRAK